MEPQAHSEMRIHPEFSYNGVQLSEADWHAFIKSRWIESPEWERSFLEFMDHWMDDKDVVEVQTSGTSGQPSKWKVSKAAMIASARLTANYFNCKERTSALLCLPGSFIAGKMMLVRAMSMGWKLTAIKPVSTPFESLNTPFDFAAFTPMQLSSLKDEEVQLLSRFGAVIIGGAAVSETLRQHLSSQCCNLFETYGMSETLSHIAVRRITKEETPFQAFNGIHLQIDEFGRLLISAPHIKHDLIQTNDVVELIGPDSFLYRGRYDRMINSGGVKLYAEVIERKLQGLLNFPYTIAAAEDEILGQKVVLYMESKGPVNSEELYQSLALLLDRYEVPKEIIIVEKLERTESGKIKIIKQKK
jgi:O-succinylbenzoic acid--CoA ligase